MRDEMTALPNKSIRISAAVGLLLALAVPATLLLHWVTRQVQILFQHHQIVQHLSGNAFPSGVEIALIALAAVVAAVALLNVLFPIGQSGGLFLACGASAAQIVLIAVETNRPGLFRAEQNAGLYTHFAWSWTDATLVLAITLAGAGTAVWLVLLVRSLAGKRCPDCAERTPLSAVTCPHCGHKFPLPLRWKRCEACERPVRTEAQVCRFCRHRFGDPVPAG